MIRFNNDYNRGAFDSVLRGLADANTVSYPGYGEDEWCGRAESVIKKLISSDDALIKFIPGATQANIVVIAAALSSVQSVIAPIQGILTAMRRHRLRIRGIKFLSFRIPKARLQPSRLPSARQSITTAAHRSILPSRSWCISPFRPRKARFTQSAS